MGTTCVSTDTVCFTNQDAAVSVSKSRTKFSSDIVSSSKEELAEPVFMKGSNVSYEGYDYHVFNIKRTCGCAEGIESLKTMISNGVDPNSLVTFEGRTCLMASVMAKDFDFVKELVKLGVDVNMTNSEGETALDLANNLPRDDIARYLRANEALEGSKVVLKHEVPVQ